MVRVFADSITSVGDDVCRVPVGYATGRGAHPLRARAGALPAPRLARCHRRHGLLLVGHSAYPVTSPKPTIVILNILTILNYLMSFHDLGFLLPKDIKNFGNNVDISRVHK